MKHSFNEIKQYFQEHKTNGSAEGETIVFFTCNDNLRIINIDPNNGDSSELDTCKYNFSDELDVWFYYTLTWDGEIEDNLVYATEKAINNAFFNGLGLDFDTEYEWKISRIIEKEIEFKDIK